MHHSIVLSGTQIAANRCTSCCKLYHCPLCPGFKPAKLNRIQSHLKVHISNAISFEDKKICKCSLNCRTAAHFHCPVCHKTVLKRSDMEGHLNGCRGKVVQTPSPATESTSDPNVPPSTPAPLDLSTEQASFSIQQSPNTSPPPTFPKTEVSVSPVVSPQHQHTNPISSVDTASQVDNSLLLQKKKTKCPHCNLLLYKKNISKHIQRKHAKKCKDVTIEDHLKSICVDSINGISAVQKSRHGFSVPV
ncbi:TRMT1-like protein [Salarias fasciatus]|nr:TRMT1-like protein [Salarias fasciatus]